MHGQDEARFFRLGFDLLSQANDVSVHGASGWEPIVAPDLFEQTIAAESLTLIANQIFQQIEFFGRKIQRFAGTCDLATSQIYFHITERNALLFLREST